MLITVKIVKEYELTVISTDVLTRPKREECCEIMMTVTLTLLLEYVFILGLFLGFSIR